ncbi:MAG: DUF1524 domain-containing protein, partial [Flavobacteriaceae bacterium]|nr:DUF1524 domain-containing protein [Flavobacteriaceae bacterium]
NLEERDKIKSEWGENLNSLGNLVVLEQNINRSINNVTSKKFDGYKKSSLTIVNDKLTEQYSDWNLRKCIIRKDYEVNKIIKYLME